MNEEIKEMRKKASDLCMEQYETILNEIASKIVTCKNNNDNLAKDDFVNNIALLENKAAFFWRIGMKMLPSEGIPVKMEEEKDPKEEPKETAVKPKRTSRYRKVATNNAEEN